MIEAMGRDTDLTQTSREWFIKCSRYEYSYHFTWLGLPIIQFPQDIVAIQELVWKIKPDLIIETGIARGGSLIFYASLLELIKNNGLVVGIDVQIRPENRTAIEAHPLFERIQLIESSSTALETVEQVSGIAAERQRIMVVLDSNHTHAHVLKELELYAPFVSVDSYLAVLDTVIENMPPEFSSDRPWGPSNSPKTAIHEFLKQHDEFIIDEEISNKLLITVAPGGYLRRVK